MKIAYIATFPPRACGIATFTQNLMSAVHGNQSPNPGNEEVVVAINDGEQEYDYPPEVGFVIRQQCRDDYVRAAAWIRRWGADICVLQHEFGIFGGDCGVYVLSLLHALDIPFIATFHTVLKDPLYLQKLIVREIARLAAGVVVMSRKAVAFLDNIYEIPAEKIHLIAHGVPERYGDAPAPADDILAPFAGHRILFTFGLLNRNKGIETVIEAMPAILARHPRTVYVVLGSTHPGVKRTAGEEYRQFLEGRIARLGLERHVFLIDRFVSEQDLTYYLKTIDLYVTPYLNEAQITSGTLSYAVGAGAAVLSTPYWHAQELLSEGRGCLFGFKQSRQLSGLVNSLLDEPARLEALQQAAFDHGQRMRWPRIGKKYLQRCARVLEDRVLDDQPQAAAPLSVTSLPPFDLSHVMRLTDDTGILQHAKYGIPNLREGYCIDDNSRALLLALMVYQRHKSPELLRLVTIYLSFIHYMQRTDGFFHNFLTFRREFADEIGSEDAFGRTIWALGMLIRHAPNSAYRELGIEIFHASSPRFGALKHLRGMANTIIGLSWYLSYFPTDEPMIACMRGLCARLQEAYRKECREDWHWFEPSLIYDNAILPLALLCASEMNGDLELRRTGLDSLAFLARICFPEGHFSPVGNHGWHTRGGAIPRFDQQAIETMAMVLAAGQAFRVSGEAAWLDKMHLSYRWFLGVNDLHVSLFDQQTGGCCDGLEEKGINRNQGAESTLAYWISHLAVLKDLESGEGPWRISPPPAQSRIAQ